MWQAVVELSRSVGGPIRDAFHVFEQTSRGNSEAVGQKMKCIMEMSHSSNQMGFPLGVVYVGETFDDKSRAAVRIRACESPPTPPYDLTLTQPQPNPGYWTQAYPQKPGLIQTDCGGLEFEIMDISTHPSLRPNPNPAPTEPRVLNPGISSETWADPNLLWWSRSRDNGYIHPPLP